MVSEIKSFDEKGYTLVFVIIITSILLLLGFTAIVLSQDNFKMKNINSISKKNFYVAEALSQETEIKLDEYLDQILEDSYREIEAYLEDNESSKLDINLIDKQLQKLFNEQIHIIKIKLENVNGYNLKLIENYDFLVSVSIEESLEIEGFNISITSIFEDKNITEKIQTNYTIEFPRYEDSTQHKNLLKKVGWVNSKW